jgi:hypothetical protein
MSRLAAAALVCALAACAPHAVTVPPNVAFGDAPSLPAPPVASNAAAPRIVAMWFSSDDVHRGQTWSGRIVTSTNVASVEVRTNLFSIDAPRRAFGDFRFSLRIFDVPPIFIRPYTLRVIARNSAGRSAEEDLPFRIR